MMGQKKGAHQSSQSIEVDPGDNRGRLDGKGQADHADDERGKEAESAELFAEGLALLIDFRA